MKKFIAIIVIIFLISVCHSSAQNAADSNFYKTKQSQWLTNKAGMWSVVMTLQPTADAKPMLIKGIEAERTMAGAFCLHEVMRPLKGAPMPMFQRLSDLDYNYNDDRWDYMSIDTRITAGIMYFSNVPDVKDSIVSYMMNTVAPGFGPQQTGRGRNMRVKNVIISINADHDLVKQYWKMTDGEEWLAVVYDYVRKK